MNTPTKLHLILISIFDFLNSTSLPWPPKEFCKLEIPRLGSCDQVLICVEKNICERRQMKELIAQFLANLPSVNIYQVSNCFATGKPMSALPQIMVQIWDMTSVGFLRSEFFKKNVQYGRKKLNPRRLRGKGKAGWTPRNNFTYCKVQNMEGLLIPFLSTCLTTSKSPKKSPNPRPEGRGSLVGPLLLVSVWMSGAYAVYGPWETEVYCLTVFVLRKKKEHLFTN